MWWSLPLILIIFLCNKAMIFFLVGIKLEINLMEFFYYMVDELINLNHSFHPRLSLHHHHSFGSSMVSWFRSTIGPLYLVLLLWPLLWESFIGWYCYALPCGKDLAHYGCLPLQFVMHHLLSSIQFLVAYPHDLFLTFYFFLNIKFEFWV